MNDSFKLITRVLLFISLISSGVVRIVYAGDRQRAAGAVEQAKIDRQQIRLPIVDRADIRFMRFYTIEGPSKSNAGPFAQDDQGFIWFGTPYGLNRFDGYNFKVFTHDPGNPKSISGSLVTAIFKDRDGVLWVGCNHLLNRFDSETETFTRYPVPYVFHISQDAAGTMWFSTPTGLYSLDRANGNVQRHAHDPNDPSSLESNDVKSAGEDKNGQFWVATSEGLDSFDRKNGKVKFHVPLKEASYPFSFYEDRFGVFWIYHVTGNGLAIFDRKTKTLTEFSFREPHSSSAALTGITGMLEDQNGELWLSTNGAGLLRFDREHRRFIRYSQRLGDPESLVQNSIRDLFADREGVIWASLGGYGLTRFTSKPLPLKRYRHDFGNPSDRDEPFVGAIYEDDDGVLWIGTHSALHRIDRSTGKFQDFQLTRGESSDIITICQDASGYLWVGTYLHGLFRFDPRTNQVKRFRHDPADPHSLSNNIVTRVFIDHNGTLWVATHDGLDRYDAATRRFTTYKVESPAVHPYHLGMAEDRRGILWLGTESSGLLRFDPGTGRFTMYQHNPDDTHTLSDNRVNSVYFDRSGTMWVGAQQGLNRFDESTGTFINYSLREGLPGSAVACILEDDDGYLWMSTDNGLAKFDPKTKKVKSYSTADGLPGPDLTGWGTCFRSKKGEMFFGGFSGATAFFPKHVSDSSYVPQVALTDFRLFGAGVLPGPGSPLKKTINHTDAITLSHEQNRFSIGFSALSYLSPATNRYRYMLEGLDTQWNEVGSDQRFASYTTLPLGTYTFRVQGATGRGPWSEPGATLRLEILPAWWNTWWFRSVWVAVSGTLLWAFYQWRIQQLQHQEKMLREAIETIPTAAWITRPDGSNEFVNRRWVEYTGLSAAGTAGLGWQVAVHPEDLDRYVANWRRSLASGEPLEDEVRFRRGTDSEYRWFLMRAVPLRDKRGSILKWYGVTTDIEDRKRAEQERQRLLQLEADLGAKIRRLVDANIVGVMITNLEGQIIEANDAFLGIVGYRREDLTSGRLRWTELTPPEWQAATQRALAQIRATGSCDLYEKEYARKDGSRVPVLVASAAIGNAENESVAFVLDLSERKRAEEERDKLRQLQSELAHINRVSTMGELAASLSHELKQPIAAAIINANTSMRWLNRDQPDVEQACQAAARVVQAGNRAAEIIDRLRSFYRKSAPPKRELVDVNEVIREMLVLVRSEASRYSIPMLTDLAAEVPRVTADRVQLQQVFLNLMLNGIEAMKDSGGELTVKSQVGNHGQLLISVSDTGVGLPAEKADQIFNAFVTTKPEGSGMGLTISRSIVESHGGSLWATANPGRGATFHFTLPAAEMVQVPAEGA